MTQPESRREQSGFTLIELLVVIIILGILSAVVVFAVRGADDKGSRAAIATDKRTIRTALEAYCVKHDKYPEGAGNVAMDELVTEKFLSSRSTYHELNKAGFPRNEGNCKGFRYRLDEVPGGGGVTQPPLDPCPVTNAWCVAAKPGSNMVMSSGAAAAPVRLANGKYFAGSNSNVYGDAAPDGAEVYDPMGAGGVDDPPGTGSWTSVPKPNSTQPGPRNMVGLDNGKVLVSYDYGAAPWQIYDPTAIPGSEWSVPTDTDYFKRTYCCLAMAKIGGAPADCGSGCGKVLVVGGEYEDNTSGALTPPIAELYDPQTNTFSETDGYPPTRVTWTLQALADGTVLMVGGLQAFIFDPKIGLGGKFIPVTPPLFEHGTGVADETVVLPDGRVLMTANGAVLGPRAEIYTPVARGAGTWAEVATCSRTPEEFCHILALADGKVLAGMSKAINSPSEVWSTETFLFDPANPLAWTPTGSLNNIWTVGRGGGSVRGPRGVLLTGGGCGNLCNKVLLAGDRSAELYTPPSG